MKISRLIHLLFFFFIFGTVSFAQLVNNSKSNRPPTKTKKLNIDTVFNFVEKMPEFPGGVGALMKYLTKNFKYPETANDEGNCSRIYITFVICKDGTIFEPKIIGSCSASLEKMTLQVIKDMPKWIPGEHNGKKVNVQMNIPIYIHLE